MSKKGFAGVNNPAMAFITEAKDKPAQNETGAGADYTPYTPSTQYTPNTPSTHNAHNTPDADKKETKTRRLNLAVFPSAARDIEKIATMRKTSPNNLINEILMEYAASHREEVEKYNLAFGED